MTIGFSLRVLALSLGFVLFRLTPTVAATAADVVAKLQRAPEAQRQALLEDEAKKEGAFSFYGTMSTDHSTRLLAAFRARYPFLKINHYRSGSTALLSKILTETRAGRYDFDAVDQEPGSIFEMARLGLIEKYLSPNRRFVREEMMDKEGFWTGGYHVVVVTGKGKWCSTLRMPIGFIRCWITWARKKAWPS